jgi:cell division protein FtsZ
MTERGSALMGIGVATGENRAAEAAKKAIMSPLLETSIDGAHGVLMNITGGVNLSLYEVNEAADIVASASDPEVNMIFGASIDEKLTDEIMVTVIATGFEHKPAQIPQQPQRRPGLGGSAEQPADKSQGGLRPFGSGQPAGDQLDIPTFLRNRGKNNPSGR